MRSKSFRTSFTVDTSCVPARILRSNNITGPVRCGSGNERATHGEYDELSQDHFRNALYYVLLTGIKTGIEVQVLYVVSQAVQLLT
jgi:hypothetical protein